MPSHDPRVDAYIAKAQPFAKPLLSEVRRRMHAAVPAVEETIKWGAPFFLVEGKLLASMAGFKAHARVGLWGGAKPSFVDVTSVEELPPAKAFTKSVQLAVTQIAGGASTREKPQPKAPVAVPRALSAALKKSPAANATFKKLPPSHRREYSEWIASAKQPATVANRVHKALVQLAKGVSLNAKYAKR